MNYFVNLIVAVAVIIPLYSHAQSPSSGVSSLISVESSQIAMVKNSSEANQLIKGWSTKTRQGVQNMLAQESSVNKEIDTSFARLLKTCELAQAMKDAAPKYVTPNVEQFERQFQSRITKLESTRSELINKFQAMNTSLINPPKECSGWGSSDLIPCIVYNYKKDMGIFMNTSVSSYYDIIINRYKVYLQIVNQAKQGCVRPDFMGKLARSDEEHLITYEAKSTQIFSRLHQSISNAFINQAAP